jgi:hypothetical protein
LDDGVIRLVEVLGGVLVLRGVTAADVAALQAEAQVHPAIPHLETLFTTVRAWRHIPNLVEMRTLLGHVISPFLSCMIQQ